jgi:hypothetical protein
MMRRVLQTIAASIAFPGIAAHELVHAYTAKALGASEVRYVAGRVGHTSLHQLVEALIGAETQPYAHDGSLPAIEMDWPKGTETWRIRAAHLSPTLAAPLAVLLGWAIVKAAAGSLPTTYAALVGLCVALNVAYFGDPSDADINPEVTG